jgi:hypothetical protein|tara:strand:- start:1764 stop:1988 length:225 start_codon:yes stop_codon:yes gene_type:complete
MNTQAQEKFSVWVLWGDTDQELKRYVFHSEDEMNFFLTGVDEAYEKIGCAEYGYVTQHKKPSLTEFENYTREEE